METVIEIYFATAIRTSIIYPAFCNGFCYVVNKCVQLKLHQKSNNIKHAYTLILPCLFLFDVRGNYRL